MTAIHTYSVFILVFALHPVHLSRKNELNLSKVDPSPIVFWPIQTSKHNVPTTEKRLAYLYGVPLSPGPTVYGGTLDALLFPGNGSYSSLHNEDGIMDGEKAMCWMFFIYIPVDVISLSAVLLAYEGSDTYPGFMLE
ncbi:uncharacterized protein [Argopecten irradians]|uniref:uncharacterized protein n=1 Tax=Argopecten irradians TaxID=31199 RepID=UPI0037140051